MAMPISCASGSSTPICQPGKFNFSLHRRRGLGSRQLQAGCGPIQLSDRVCGASEGHRAHAGCHRRPADVPPVLPQLRQPPGPGGQPDRGCGQRARGHPLVRGAGQRYGWSIHQQGTYAPGDGAYRWMGSSAADALGNLALGFSISSSSMFPSIHYAGRLANHLPGALAQGEAVLVSGGGSQNLRPRVGGIIPRCQWTRKMTALFGTPTSTTRSPAPRGLANPHRRLPLLRLRFTRHRHAIWHSHPCQHRARLAPGWRHGHRGDFVDGHRRGREIRVRPAAGQL